MNYYNEIICLLKFVKMLYKINYVNKISNLIVDFPAEFFIIK